MNLHRSGKVTIGYSTMIGATANHLLLGGAAGLFGPFGRKPFGALGSGVTTSPFSQLVGAGYSSPA